MIANSIKQLQAKAKVKMYILKHFPKPMYETQILKYYSKNINPSLFGNVIECFYYLNQHINFQLENHLDCINSAINHYKKIKAGQTHGFHRHREIILEKEAYKKLIALMKLESTETTPFSFIRIERNNWDTLKTFKVIEELGINISFWSIPILCPEPEFFLIILKEDLHNYLDKIQTNLELAFKRYKLEKKISNQFLYNLIIFAHLCNKFAFLSGVNIFLIDKEFTTNAKKILLEVFKNITLEKNVLYKPSLAIGGITARPDFIIGNEIIEIKATKKFFSNSDYIQVILYLLFASEKSNRKYYGKIDGVIIRYPLFDKSVEIKNPFNNHNIKTHLPQVLKFARMRK